MKVYFCCHAINLIPTQSKVDLGAVNYAHCTLSLGQMVNSKNKCNYDHTDVLSKVTVCSHSCRMGGLHS